MACEFLYNDIQDVALNGPVLFRASIPCTKGYVIHSPNGSGIFTLRGIVNNTMNCFARYTIEFTGNISIPTGGAA